MNCPKCNKVEIKEQIILKRKFPFKFIKEIYFYCPLCDFENKKTFILSKEGYTAELLEKGFKAENTKNIIQTHINGNGNKEVLK